MNGYHPHNPLYGGDCYYSDQGGAAESLHVFVEGNFLPERMAGSLDASGAPPVVGELGFGTGLNLLVLVREAVRQGCTGLHFLSVERHPLSPEQAVGALVAQGMESRAVEALQVFHARLADAGPGWVTEVLEAGTSGGSIRILLDVWKGDVEDFLEAWRTDRPGVVPWAWFPDGHDPAENGAMWSPAVIGGMAALGRSGFTTLATWTACGMVKTRLREAGFTVVRRRGFGRKRHMIRCILA